MNNICCGPALSQKNFAIPKKIENTEKREYNIYHPLISNTESWMRA